MARGKLGLLLRGVDENLQLWAGAEAMGPTFICRYLWVCECSRNSMALASSGSSVSESSEPKPCSTWAISFTVTAKVSMACGRGRQPSGFSGES